MKMKHQKSIISLFLIFSFLIGLTLAPSVKADVYPMLLNKIAIQHLVYSNQWISNNDFSVAILNRDTLLIYRTYNNESSFPCRDGFVFVTPISNLYLSDFILSLLSGSFPSLNGIYVNAVVFPALEFYNDTNSNNVCDIVRGSSTNTTEAVYEVIPLDYSNVSISNLTTIEPIHIQESNKPTSYLWSVQYNDVIVGIYNATLNNATGIMDGTHFGNDSYTYIRYDYNYTFTNNRWELKRAVNISAYDNSEEGDYYVNMSLAIVQLHLIGQIGVSTSPISGANSSNLAFSTNTSTPSKIVNFLLGSKNIGVYDINQTYYNYTLDSENYNATGVINPSVTVNGDLWLTNFTNNASFDISFSGIGLTSRTCYPTYNGSALYHDPLFLMPLFYTQIPLYWVFLPDAANAAALQQQNLMFIVLIIALSVLCIVMAAEALGTKTKGKVNNYRDKRAKTKREEEIAEQRRENLKVARKVKKALHKRKNH